MASILKEDLTSQHANVTSDEYKGSFLPPSLIKTQKIVEDNESNRGQKYPLQGVTGFNQIVIKLKLIFNITICDYDEEKKRYPTRFLIRAAL